MIISIDGLTTEQKLIRSLGIDIVAKEMFINGRLIRYITAGQGDPLLLIHGANFGWGMWYANIPALAQHFKVYAIDLPGAGRSSLIDYATLDPEHDLFSVVEKFVLKLNLQNFNIIGCSIGGWLALQLAARYPGNVKAVVVTNTVGFADYMGWSDKIIGFYPLARLVTKTALSPARTNRKSIDKFLRGIFYDHELYLKQEFLGYFYETMERSHNLLFISRLTALAKIFVMTDKLPQITQKVLILWGNNDKIMPLEKNEINFGLLPSVSISIMDAVGHLPPMEKPEEYNERVLNFFSHA